MNLFAAKLEQRKVGGLNILGSQTGEMSGKLRKTMEQLPHGPLPIRRGVLQGTEVTTV